MSQLQDAESTTAAARVQAAEAYVKALRTGEASAAIRAGGYLAPDVVLRSGNDEIAGQAAVLARITGQWPLTPVLVHGAWSAPRVDGDQVLVSAEFGPIGAAPTRLDLTFDFNLAGQIAAVSQTLVPQTPVAADGRLPEFVKGLINGALANATPICVAYTDVSGQPVLSLRGSTQVYSDIQLCIWVRNASGGLVSAMQGDNRRLSLLYRDSKLRTTLIIQGQGQVSTDPAVRDRVYELIPEVEQNHDPGRRGAALLIDITQLQGTTVRGPIKLSR
jgi:hypothetical protein